LTLPSEIKAEVIDIKHDTPCGSDVFFVDTNVWLPIAYDRLSQGSNPNKRQIRSYPAYVKSLLKAGGRLLRCNLVLAELGHNIEDTEREIFAHVSNKGYLKPKEFRHNYPDQRPNVVSRIETAWDQVKALSNEVPVDLSSSRDTDRFSKFRNCAVDLYDLFFLESVENAKISNVLTDDGDYGSVAGIRVFTSNSELVESARECGRLIERKPSSN
jgi:hypothetical protein